MHGLHWLCANLAEQRPLALVVDDAHWADEDSLRFLVYLARRLEDLPIALLVAARARHPGGQGPLLASLAGDPAVSVLELAPLSSAACAQYLRDRIPEAPALEFTDAGEQATGGNPFLLGEFCLTVGSLEVGLDAAGAEAAARLTSDRAGRSVLLRIGRLPPAAEALARAVALFPDGAEFRHVAALAELSPEDAGARRTCSPTPPCSSPAGRWRSRIR